LESLSNFYLELELVLQAQSQVSIDGVGNFTFGLESDEEGVSAIIPYITNYRVGIRSKAYGFQLMRKMARE
jgi:hypothetical protein